MTAQNKLAGAPSTAETWQTINWPTVERNVQRLQMRIAKATREKRFGKVKALQWLLTHSYDAKLLAIKRVSSNKGSKTPGIDGIIWNSDKKKISAIKQIKRRGYKPRPLKRIYIPKKNGKRRPLGIPCMIDRCYQALHLLGLEPVSETLADKDAYGFRPRRSTADAIEQCFIALSRKFSSHWVLEGDIKSCFDKIGHQWMLENIPMDRYILNKWLKSGYIDNGVFHHTEEGTPQGGIISPTLMLLTLRGLEDAAKNAAPKSTDKVHTIAYADDFVITGSSKEILETQVMPAVKAFLLERGLELSEEKTKITHISDGFDFLGFNIRKYKDKLIIKPAKENVLAFVRSIKEFIKDNRSANTGYLIARLNPKIIGWGNYYKHVVSSKTFSYVDQQIFESLLRWAKRRHPRKGAKWVVKKYYSMGKANEWLFHGWIKMCNKRKYLQLARLTQRPITRHIKIRKDANPYDPKYTAYLSKRSNKGARNTWIEIPKLTF